MTPCPAIERSAGGFQRASPLARDVSKTRSGFCKHPTCLQIRAITASGCLRLVESGLGLVKRWFKVVQGWLKLVEKG